LVRDGPRERLGLFRKLKDQRALQVHRAMQATG